MSDEMVKKSVDITQEDDQWLEQSHINFSKFVRRKVAEKRADSIKDSVKADVYNDVDKVVKISQDLREEWNEFKEDLKEEYDVEIMVKENHTFGFEIQGERYTSDWGGNVDHAEGDDHLDKAEQFASEWCDKWHSLLGDFGDRVEKETNFQHSESNPLTIRFSGNYGLKQFTLQTTNLPKSEDSVDVMFESRVWLDLDDLEQTKDEI
jgi:hypothetical protein